MASRYWVGGTGTWDNADTTHWSATSGGAGGASVPVAGDDVYFNGSSGAGTITLNYSPTIQTFDHTGYTGTFGSTGSITITVTGHMIQSLLTTYSNNSSQSLRLSAGLASRDMHLVTTRMFGAGTLTIDTGLTFGEFYFVYQTPLITGFYSANIGGPITVNTSFTVDASGFVNNYRIRSNTYGTQRVITLGAACTVSLSDVSFEWVSFAGTPSPVSGTRLSNIIGNSGITFTSPVTYYWIGNAGNYSDITKYSLTSGGSSAGVRPLLHDKVIFDDNSFSATGQALALNINYCADLDFTPLSGAKIPTLTLSAPSGQSNFFAGSVKLKAGMTTTGSATVWTMVGGRDVVFAQNGATLSSVSRLETRNIGFICSLGSDLVLTSAINTGGTPDGGFDANGYNVTCTTVTFSNATTRTVRMGLLSRWTLTGTGNVFNLGTMTGLTFDAQTSNILITDTSASTKTIAHGSSLALYDITITPGGSGAVIFGANPLSLHSLNLNGGSKTLQLTAGAGSTTTIAPGGWNVNGTAGNLVSITSATPGSQAYISVASGIVSGRYLSIIDSNAAGGASFQAINSTDAGNNTGWVFSTQLTNPTTRVGQKFATFGGNRPYRKTLYSDIHHVRKLGGF